MPIPRKIRSREDVKITLDKVPRGILVALNNFEKAVGGREKLVEIISYCQENPEEAEQLANIVGDPRNHQEQLANLCATAGLTVAKFLRTFSSGRAAKAYIEAMESVYPEAPQVAREVMELAKIQKRRCSACRGLGKIRLPNSKGNNKGRPRAEYCLKCDGTGLEILIPDLDRQKVALEISGILRQAPQIMVDQSRKSQTVVNLPAPMRSFITATNRILYGPDQPRLEPSTPVDAEVVPSAEEEVAEEATE